VSGEKKYDLEERTEKFSLRIRDLCRQLKQDIINREYISQLIRSAGSVAANYIEANDKVGEKDLSSLSHRKHLLYYWVENAI